MFPKGLYTFGNSFFIVGLRENGSPFISTLWGGEESYKAIIGKINKIN